MQKSIIERILRGGADNSQLGQGIGAIEPLCHCDDFVEVNKSKVNKLIKSIVKSEALGVRSSLSLKHHSLFTHHSSLMKRAAFTLAEVLITLGIIGVVAAMTLPTLIQNYKKQQTVAQVKKVYAEIAQVLEMAEAEHGSMDQWNFITLPITEGSQVYYWLKNYFLPYFKASKVCLGQDEIKEKCSDLSYASVNGGNVTLFASDAYIAYIISASGYGILLTFGGKTSNNLTSVYSPHVHFYVDINGPKQGKGMLGKDVFVMSANFGKQVADGVSESAKKSGFVMFGAGWQPALSRDELINNEKFGCSKTGRFCGALIQADGWEISHDYPW